MAWYYFGMSDTNKSAALKSAHTLLSKFIDDYEARKPHPSINYNDAKKVASEIRKALGNEAA
jgi:hypothetical protein